MIFEIAEVVVYLLVLQFVASNDCSKLSSGCELSPFWGVNSILTTASFALREWRIFIKEKK